MKILKRFFCIFMAVLVIFFSINNSYFSPHKMDTVEAASIVVGGGVVITADLVIKLVCALAAAGLSVGLIVEWQDMDLEVLLNDFHDWLQDNITVLDSIGIDGTSALKEWALTDEWTVIEGGASNPEPSPSPGEFSSSNSWWEKLIGGIPYSMDTISLANLIAAGTVAVEDFINKNVILDDGFLTLSQEYISDKVDNLEDFDPGMVTVTDPVSAALLSRYNISDGFYWNGEYDVSEGSYLGELYTLRSDHEYFTFKFSSDYPVAAYINYSSGTDGVLFFYYYDGSFMRVPLIRSRYLYGNLSYTDTVQFAPFWNNDFNCNVPVFSTYEEMQNYLLTGVDIGVINGLNKNYIDTDDEYGWASTAALSPSDLIEAFPELAGLLGSKTMSLGALANLIDNFKLSLEAQNPNASAAEDTDPVIYPDVPTYTEILKQSIEDTLPDAEPVTDTDPDSGTDTGTQKDYTGLIGTIIGILRDILQAVKDFFSWFIIDFALIRAHLLEAINTKPEFEQLQSFVNLIGSLQGQFSDSYEYPKISMKTPDILQPYLKSSEILLIDFEDYAEYFIMVRSAIGFAIIIGFVMWFIRDGLRIEFSVG